MMTNELLTREDLQHFRTQLVNELKEVLQQPSQTTRQWLKSSEVRKILGISHGTSRGAKSISNTFYTKMIYLLHGKYSIKYIFRAI